MQSRWLLLALFLTVGLFSHAAKPFTPELSDPTRESWRQTTFRELKGRSIEAIAEGPDGCIWVGTSPGAVRYDGLNWDEFGVAQGLSEATRSFASGGGQLYAATRFAIYRFDRREWVKVFPENDDRTWIIEDICLADDRSLWAATSWGAVCVSPDGSTTLHTTPAIVSEFEASGDSDCQLRVIDCLPKRSWGEGLGVVLHGSSDKLTLVTELAPGGPAAKAGVGLGDIVHDVEHSVLRSRFQPSLDVERGVERTILFSRRGDDQRISVAVKSADNETATPTFRPRCVIQDRRGKIWFGTDGGDVLSFNPNVQDSWVNHNVKHDVPAKGAVALAARETGVVVMPTDRISHEIDFYDGEGWRPLTGAPKLNRSIAVDDMGMLWIGSAGSFNRIDPETDDISPIYRQGLTGHDVRVCSARDGSIWAAAEGGLLVRMETHGDRWLQYNGLVFLARDHTGGDWFLTHNYTVVRNQGNRWTEYDVSDGLLELPVTGLVARSGEVWLAGSHHGVAATCVLRGGEWQLETHRDLSWCIDRRSAMEDRDGNLWFGAAGGVPSGKGFRGGAIRYDGERWSQVCGTTSAFAVEGITQTRDGSVWFGGGMLLRFRNELLDWNEDLRKELGVVATAIAADASGNLWVGTPRRGVARIALEDQEKITWFDQSSGLSHNGVRNIVVLRDGRVVVRTYGGFDYFDGRTMSPFVLPSLQASQTDVGGFRLSGDGGFWCSRSRVYDLNYRKVMEGKVDRRNIGVTTSRFLPNQLPPSTRFSKLPEEFRLGNAALVSWKGTDRWNQTSSGDLTYSYRVDDEPWSAFQSKPSVELRDLAAGNYQIQVRARDSEGNVDPSPAIKHFRIVPPVWQTAWFQLLLVGGALLATITLLQTVRVFMSEASLRRSNQQLVIAEEGLRSVNSALEARVRERTGELEESNSRLRVEVAERRSAESHLFASERRYRSIVEDQTEFVVRFDAGGKPEFANEAFLRTLGDHDVANVDGPLSEQLDKETKGRLAKCIEGLDAETNVRTAVVRVECEGDAARWEEWTARTIKDPDGEVFGYQAIGRDITELQEAEEKLHEKEKLLAHLGRVSAIGEMVAEISHEINQPLSAIANYSSASKHLLEQLDDEEQLDKIKEWNGLISEQTSRVGKIIDGLRRFGRPASNRKRVAIDDVIVEALAMTESRTRIDVDRIDVVCDSGFPSVHADPVQLEQVLVNLIRNACDGMKEIPVGERSIRIEVAEKDEFLEVTVTDTGKGIDRGIAHELFDAFKTTKCDGMGIGLAISRSIVEAHGGSIHALIDRPGGHFVFSIPVDREAQSTRSPRRGLPRPRQAIRG